MALADAVAALTRACTARSRVSAAASSSAGDETLDAGDRPVISAKEDVSAISGPKTRSVGVGSTRGGAYCRSRMPLPGGSCWDGRITPFTAAMARFVDMAAAY